MALSWFCQYASGPDRTGMFQLTQYYSYNSATFFKREYITSCNYINYKTGMTFAQQLSHGNIVKATCPQPCLEAV
jgi:hypothetical protein